MNTKNTVDTNVTDTTTTSTPVSTSAPSDGVLTTPVMSSETATKVRAAKRRKYGTGLLVKRVVLLNGKPAGRGKPKASTRSKRTVVYIPVDSTYDVEVYGTGSSFRSSRNPKPIKTVDRAQFVAKYPKAVIA